jgi:hypothetical protein
VPASAGTSVTVFEMTGWLVEHTYDISTLMGGGGMFWTAAMWMEMYTVTSDGNFVTIHCYRDPPYYCTGFAVGNNIVAVRLNGVPDHPEGLWASVVMSYTIGVEGTAESVYNALGPVDQLGPYANSPCTYLGDFDSEMTLGFGTSQPVVEAVVDFDMDVFNLASKGNYVTAYVELPEGYDVASVKLETVMLNGMIPAVTRCVEIEDHDEDGVPDVAFKFARNAVGLMLQVGDDIYVIVSGTLEDGTPFSGSDVIDTKAGPSKLYGKVI